MGLKTRNYKVKSMNNYVLPEAYAIITDIRSGISKGYAEIGVFADRESAFLRAKPFEVRKIEYDVNRNQNDREVIYAIAKTPKFGEVFNEQTQEFEQGIVDAMFSDWENDIV